MTQQNAASTQQPPPARFNKRHSAIIAGISLAVLAIGAAAGTGGTRLAQRWQPQSVMLLQPTPISTMQDGSPIAERGSVAETFGHFFILQDDSGRALVDLGPRGDHVAATKGETLTVQGRFDRGVIHAQVVTYTDGRTLQFGPPGPPLRPGRRPPPSPGYGPEGAPPRPPRASGASPPLPPASPTAFGTTAPPLPGAQTAPQLPPPPSR